MALGIRVSARCFSSNLAMIFQITLLVTRLTGYSLSFLSIFQTGPEPLHSAPAKDENKDLPGIEGVVTRAAKRARLHEESEMKREKLTMEYLRVREKHALEYSRACEDHIWKYTREREDLTGRYLRGCEDRALFYASERVELEREQHAGPTIAGEA